MMKYFELTSGNDTLKFSKILVGSTMSMARMKEEEIFKIYDAFADLGGNCIDTARAYNDYKAEAMVARYLDSRGKRNEFVIATKGGQPPLFLPGRPPLSAKDLAHQAEESRRNLRLDTLPLYYLHRDDTKIPVAQIMDGLFPLQDRGVIRHIACSNWTAERIRQANDYASACGREGFVAVSNQWSLARFVPGAGDQTLVHTDDVLCAFHRESGIPLLPFTSLAQGYLSKLAEDKPIGRNLIAEWGLPENAAIAARAKELAVQKHMTVAQIAQCFFYAQDFQVVPVMSFSSVAQMEEAAAATEMTITPEECAWLLHG